MSQRAMPLDALMAAMQTLGAPVPCGFHSLRQLTPHLREDIPIPVTPSAPASSRQPGLASEDMEAEQPRECIATNGTPSTATVDNIYARNP